MKAIILGQIYEIDKDLNLIAPNKTFTKAEMQVIATAYKGVNRIHKPMALLFWTDVKNGEGRNWIEFCPENEYEALQDTIS